MSERRPAYGIYDKEGNLVADVVPVRYKIKGKWVRVFQEPKRTLMLRHPEVHAQSYLVLSYLETVSDWNNSVPVAAEVARQLGLVRQTVARAYAELVAAEFLIQRGRVYYISPLIAWKGDAGQYETTMRQLFGEMEGKTLRRIKELGGGGMVT